MLLTNFPVGDTAIRYETGASFGRNRCVVFRIDGVQKMIVEIGANGKTYETSDDVLAVRMTNNTVYYMIKQDDEYCIRAMFGEISERIYIGPAPDDFIYCGGLFISIGNRVIAIRRTRQRTIFECGADSCIKFSPVYKRINRKMLLQQLYYVCFTPLSPIGPYHSRIYAHGDYRQLANKTHQMCPMSHRCYNNKGVTVWSCGRTIIRKWQRQYHKYLPAEWQEKIMELRIVLIMIPTEIFEIIVQILFVLETVPLSESQDAAMWDTLIAK